MDGWFCGLGPPDQNPKVLKPYRAVWMIQITIPVIFSRWIQLNATRLSRTKWISNQHFESCPAILMKDHLTILVLSFEGEIGAQLCRNSEAWFWESRVVKEDTGANYLSCTVIPVQFEYFCQLIPLNCAGFLAWWKLKQNWNVFLCGVLKQASSTYAGTTVSDNSNSFAQFQFVSGVKEGHISALFFWLSLCKHVLLHTRATTSKRSSFFCSISGFAFHCGWWPLCRSLFEPAQLYQHKLKQPHIHDMQKVDSAGSKLCMLQECTVPYITNSHCNISPGGCQARNRSEIIVKQKSYAVKLESLMKFILSLTLFPPEGKSLSGKTRFSETRMLVGVVSPKRQQTAFQLVFKLNLLFCGFIFWPG